MSCLKTCQYFGHVNTLDIIIRAYICCVKIPALLWILWPSAVKASGLTENIYIYALTSRKLCIKCLFIPRGIYKIMHKYSNIYRAHRPQHRKEFSCREAVRPGFVVM